jgi:myosin heavy subunit
MSGEDLSQYLRPTRDRTIQEQTRAFDSKKWVWVNDDEECFKSAQVKSQKGDQITIELPDGQEKTVDVSQTQQMNPPKFEKTEDMASLTYLNEASVLHNLKQRYYSGLIYTYSGLFCVAINPYRNLPIYTEHVVKMFKGKRRTEMPPHIFSIADNAYSDMLQDRDNQSILITGESGAGKTENTKKVIQYFAHVAPNPSHKTSKRGTLEDQVIEANPVLEAFGNAKTIRNDNSSRFGKFIRIHFGPNGKISGADIEYYLLEKSRVIFQQPGERCYHIFYQILTGASQDLLNELLLTNQIKQYKFLTGGTTSVDGVDDAAMFKATREAMTVLAFNPEEQMQLLRTVAAVCHFGNIEVKQRPREEQAEMPDTKAAEKLSHLLGINSSDFVKYLLKPRIRIRNEYVQKGRDVAQVNYSVGALSKALYERMFRWLVTRINITLDTRERKNTFIGVLDIAGFEIFKYNSFEQLCINFTNEKLQQFFNHHMFILEQEEYKREGITWEFIDFGLDLQPCIDLIEKQMGILALLDEECLFPKATDKSFVEKLHVNHNGKSPNYSKPQFKAREQVAHFEVIHYAGTVPYTVEGWLNKNKDPLNDSVVELLKKSTDTFVQNIWSDYVSYQSDAEGSSRRGKGSQFITVGQRHKESLNNLMSTLRRTNPHFVRCIIPNEMKRAGVLDAHLVIHQLRCNGVLEGIRICRKGFPNRVIYQEFRQRYTILAPKAVPPGFMDSRKATRLIIDELQLNESEYRMGSSKVFFKAGVLGHLEDMRDERLGKIIGQFQAYCRGYLMRKHYKKLLDQRLAIAVIQRNVRKHLFIRDWQWWRIFTKMRPMLKVVHTDQELKQKEEEISKLRDKVVKEEQSRKTLEEQQAALLTEKQDLLIQLQREQDIAAEADESVRRLTQHQAALEEQILDLGTRVDEEVENNANISSLKRKLEAELEQTREVLKDMETNLAQLEHEKNQKDKDNAHLDLELEQVNESLAKANKDKRALEEKLQDAYNSLHSEEDKANHLNKIKARLEAASQETQEELSKEKATRTEVEKQKRKLEGDLKSTQEKVEVLIQQKDELELGISHKSREIDSLNQSLEDEQNNVAALQRRIRELEARIEELEEDLENERSLRKRVEKQKADIQNELEALQEALEEEGGHKDAQIALNRKREEELQHLHKLMDESTAENEKNIADLKKKHANVMKEIEEKLDQVQKSKAKFERESSSYKTEVADLQSHVEELQRSGSSLDKKLRLAEEQLTEMNSKFQDQASQLSNITSAKNKAESNNVKVSQELEAAESKAHTMERKAADLQAQLEDVRNELSDATHSKRELQGKLKQAEMSLKEAQESLEEEQDGKAELQKQLVSAKSEAAQWKNKHENEDLQRIEELEDAKKKLQGRLNESEENASTLQSKLNSAEKAKSRIRNELDDANLALDDMKNQVAGMEKTKKKHDAEINEWKAKYETRGQELDSAQRDARRYNTEFLKLKSQFEGLEEQYEVSKRDNKHLQGEVNDLEKQLTEGGVSAHELAKTRKTLENQIEELTQQLQDAEDNLELEEKKVLSIQLERGKYKQEVDRRMAEKDIEAEADRKNLQRQLEEVQSTLENEMKAKSSLIRQRKSVEEQVAELEERISAGEKDYQELAKNNKKLSAHLKEVTGQLDSEQQQREGLKKNLEKAEKKNGTLQVELDEARSQFEHQQRLYKNSEAERNESSDRVLELSSKVTSLEAAKRKADQQIHSLQEEFDEAESENRENSEKLKNSLEQVARLQSELFSHQESVSSLEKQKSTLDRQVKDLQSQLDEATGSAARAAKKELTVLKQKVSELESQLEADQKAKSDAERALKRSDRRLKEKDMMLEEEKNRAMRAEEQVTRMNTKAKTLRRQVEDAVSYKMIKSPTSIGFSCQTYPKYLKFQLSKLKPHRNRS